MANFVEDFLGGLQAGQKLSSQRRRQEALDLYGRDADAGIRAMGAVDPEEAAGLIRLDQLGQERKVRREAAAYVDRGDMPGAARAWMKLDPQVAAALNESSDRELDSHRSRFGVAGGIFAGVRRIPMDGPGGLDARRTFVAAHREQVEPVAKTMGMTMDQVLGLPNWADDDWLDANLDSTLAGRDAAIAIQRRRLDASAREQTKFGLERGGLEFEQGPPARRLNPAPAGPAAWQANHLGRFGGAPSSIGDVPWFLDPDGKARRKQW